MLERGETNDTPVELVTRGVDVGVFVIAAEFSVYGRDNFGLDV
jgi:hypothetical protein